MLSIETIIHGHLLFKKVCAESVPKRRSMLLRPSNICTGLNWRETFLERVVTYDETWVRFSMEWRHNGYTLPNKFKAQLSAYKIVASVFWDSEGGIHIAIPPHGVPINAQYYGNLLRHVLRRAIRKSGQGNSDRSPYCMTTLVHMRQIWRRWRWQQRDGESWTTLLQPSLSLQGISAVWTNEHAPRTEILNWHSGLNWLRSQEKPVYVIDISSFPGRWGKYVNMKGEHLERRV